MPTKTTPLNPVLLAEMVHARVRREAEVATTRRQRRPDLETLDRDNPFLTPSPDAPWRPAEPPSRSPAEPRTDDLVGIVVVVWSVVVALALVAFAIRG
jgi:hypothetical protein